MTAKTISIPLLANGWVTKHKDNSAEIISTTGLANWISSETVISVYFYTKYSGSVDISVKCKVPNGKSRIMFSTVDNSYKVDVEGNQYKDTKVGNFIIKYSGYVRVDMQGVTKTGSYFADVSHLDITGDIVGNDGIYFIPNDNKDVSINFSRRGPSVHLNYVLPNTGKCEYYYNEVMVPKGFDPVGSYFMAIGFNNGYFGIQVNSEKERHILFSVWSPQKTNNPSDVTIDNRVILKGKGHDVIVKEFGGEGEGGQSHINYNWTSDTSYKFIVRGIPETNNTTTYTAWFAELNQNWRLIASFNRPKTNEYLSGFRSFLENFSPETGFITRKGFYSNQWVCDVSGKWHEVTKAVFNCDLTAKNKIRHDFDGGVEVEFGNQMFYLQNCGFFDSHSLISYELKRNENKIQPKIDLKTLPNA